MHTTPQEKIAPTVPESFKKYLFSPSEKSTLSTEPVWQGDTVCSSNPWQLESSQLLLMPRELALKVDNRSKIGLS